MSDRYPLAPLMEALRIRPLEPGWQNNSDSLGGLVAVAVACGVTHRTARRWAADGIPARHVDHLAVHVARRMPWVIWPEWSDDDPTEDYLAGKPCRCQNQAAPLPNGTCDRCGGHLPVARSRAA